MYVDNSLSAILLREQELISRQSRPVSTSNVLITPPPAQDPETTDAAQSLKLENQLDEFERPNRLDPRDIVSFNGIEIDLDEETPSAEPDPLDIHKITPREMADISMDLYIDGNLSFDEYSMLAFQPELHPDFEETIGALTGDQADPDRPRDYLEQWQDRLDFEKRYPSENPKTLKQIERILAVLGTLGSPLNFVA